MRAPLFLTPLAILAAMLLVGVLFHARRRPRSPRDPARVATATGLVPERPRASIVAQDWPKEHATPEELRALEAWRARHALVTRIDGLDDLLSGEYPTADEPEPFVKSLDGSWISREPWIYRSAMVWGGEGLEDEEAIASLERSIPAELVSKIGLAIYYG